MRQSRIEIGNNSFVDYWNNGDGTVSLVTTNTEGKEVELVFRSSSMLLRISQASEKARQYLKLAKRPPTIYS